MTTRPARAVVTPPRTSRKGGWIEKWKQEDSAFWDGGGARVAAEPGLLDPVRARGLLSLVPVANVNSFYPQRRKGWAPGLNASGGNIGVAVVQFVGLPCSPRRARRLPRPAHASPVTLGWGVKLLG